MQLYLLILNRSPELGIDTWTLDKYVDPKESNLPIIMRLEDVNCQLSRGRIEHIEPPLWITATMDRVSV